MQTVKLGLRENWKQFTLLVIVNMFVGGMIGIERTIFPEFASSHFGISSKTAILSFITAFGISKAIANYYTGLLANSFGRRALLIGGWIVALPIPYILLFAPNWSWIVFANILLGISQGLTWSSTVVMKIDLVGEKSRGFAMGLNEFAGYFTVGMVALLTGYIAQTYGVTPYPFYLGILFSVLGLLISVFWIRDTRSFVKKEAEHKVQVQKKNIFLETTLRNKTLSTVSQAGLVNNLNDGMMWGLFPMILSSHSFTIEEIGIITSLYPTVWGIFQLFTGTLSDHFSKKLMLFWGMLLQGIAISIIPFQHSFFSFSLQSIFLGIGTAMVYPTFLTSIASATHPENRAESIGIFRLWRDLGYAIGAILSGITADFMGIETALILIGLITIFSALVIKFRMPDKSQ